MWVEDLVTDPQHPWVITLDPALGKKYRADLGVDKVFHANPDKSNIQELVATGLCGAWVNRRESRYPDRVSTSGPT